MKLSAFFWASVVVTACASGASAQRMFRCGSSYQDRPCESGVPDKVFRSGGAEAASANALKAVADPDCIKRGADAQQIMWARESGKTAEDQSRLAQNDQQRRLIAEVYAVRGSAPQVRDAIQAKCQQDREQAAQAAALVAVALKAQGAGNSASDVKPVDNDTAREPSPAKATPMSSSNICDGFKAQLEGIRSQERLGGSAQVMESLSQRRNSIEKTARAQGC
jgi:hypothetical protein